MDAAAAVRRAALGATTASQGAKGETSPQQEPRGHVDGDRREAGHEYRDDDDEEQDAAALAMFDEPADFRPPTPPPTTAHYDPPPPTASDDDDDGARASSRIHLSLVGSHPLWGHHLWNAAPVLSDYLVSHSSPLLAGARVLELGAASGLPSVVAAKWGASRVVATDWPDVLLVRNLAHNLERNGVPSHVGTAVGYVWGADPTELLALLDGGTRHDDGDGGGDAGGSTAPSAVAPRSGQRRFDLALLSDLVFNHVAHEALLDTLESCLDSGAEGTEGEDEPVEEGDSVVGTGTSKCMPSVPPTPPPPPPPPQCAATSPSSTVEAPPTPPPIPPPRPPISSSSPPRRPCALCFFTHHRPHLADRDMRFFSLAAERGWICERVGEWHRQPMFKDDPGPAEVRGTVHGWSLRRRKRSARPPPSSVPPWEASSDHAQMP